MRNSPTISPRSSTAPYLLIDIDAAVRRSALATGSAVAVAEPADRLDRRLVGIRPAELAAQPEHGELHPLLADAGRVVPRLGEQLVRGQHRAGVPDQCV